MAHLIFRNAACIVRRYTGNNVRNVLHYASAFSTPTFCVPQFAKYCSENRNLPDFQRSSSSSTNISPKETEDVGIIQEFEEKFSPEQREYMLPSRQKKEYEDILLKRIKKSQSTSEVFNIYEQHSSVMNIHHLLNIMQVLQDLVAEESVDCWEVQEEPQFRSLCQRLLKSSRRMESYELLKLLHCLCRLKVNVNSKLVTTVLQLLRHSVNDLELKNILHLEFLLKKFPPTPLSEALRIAIPMLLENALSQEPLEDFSVKRLSLILSIGVHGKIRNLGPVINEIYKQGVIRSGYMAQSLLWSLLAIYTGEGSPIPLQNKDILATEVLMKECMEVYSKNIHNFTVSQVETTLSKVCTAYDNPKCLCYNEHFLNAIALYCIKKELPLIQISHIIRKLLRMNFVSGDLTDYALSLIVEEGEDAISTKCSITALTTVIACMPSSDRQRDAIVILLNHHSTNLDFDTCLQIPALSFALDLLSMDYYHQPLLEVLTSREFLSQYVGKYQNRNVTNRQLLQLDQVLSTYEDSSLRVPEEYLTDIRSLQENMTFPDFESELCFRLGQIYEDEDFIHSGVLTENDLHIDHLLILDELDRPVKVPRNGNSNRICDISIPQHYKRIAILDVRPVQTYGPMNIFKRYLHLHQKLLEDSGFIVVPVLQSTLHRLTSDEKNLYIKRLIDSAR